MHRGPGWASREGWTLSHSPSCHLTPSLCCLSRPPEVQIRPRPRVSHLSPLLSAGSPSWMCPVLRPIAKGPSAATPQKEKQEETWVGRCPGPGRGVGAAPSVCVPSRAVPSFAGLLRSPCPHHVSNHSSSLSAKSGCEELQRWKRLRFSALVASATEIHFLGF